MPQELPESEIYVLLAKQRRRLLLRILHESPTSLSASELAKHIAELECEDPTAEDIDSIALSLYHNHLPQLGDADVVTVDETDGTVNPARNFDALVRTLERVGGPDLPWSDG